MDQTWRVHYKYKNYAADSHGRVKNVKTNSIIHPTIVRDNIYVFNLCDSVLLGPSKMKKFQLHNFIYECWHGPIPEGYRGTFYNKDYGPIIHGPSGSNLKLTQINSTKSYYSKKLPQYLVDINGTETIYKSMKEVADNLRISTKKVKDILQNGGLGSIPSKEDQACEIEFEITPW